MDVKADRQRGRRADARRNVDAILAAARDELAEHPAAGLQAIAERAGVHRATLHRHFSTREALIAQLYEAYLDDAEAAIREVDAGAEDLLAEIEALTRRIYEVNGRWRAFSWAPAYTRETQDRRREMAATVQGLFVRAAERGVLRSDMSVRELQAAWGSPILFFSARISEGDWTLDEVAEHTLRLITPAG